MSLLSKLRSCYGVALTLTSCTPNPMHAFCARMRNDCTPELAFDSDPQQCAAQLPNALGAYSTRCRECVMSLSCSGLARAVTDVAEGRGLDALCMGCAPIVDPSQAVLTASTATLLPGVSARTEKANASVERFCTMIGESSAGACDYLRLLSSTDACIDTLSSRLHAQPPGCSRCVTSLECSGVLSLLQGETKLDALCPYCPQDLNHACSTGTCESSRTPILTTIAIDPPEGVNALLVRSGLLDNPYAPKKVANAPKRGAGP